MRYGSGDIACDFDCNTDVSGCCQSKDHKYKNKTTSISQREEIHTDTTDQERNKIPRPVFDNQDQVPNTRNSEQDDENTCGSERWVIVIKFEMGLV